MSKKVNLFIVGAMKAGTTSLSNMMSSHPEIYVCPIKEPNHFLEYLPRNIYDENFGFDFRNYMQNTFPRSLHIARVRHTEDYEALFSLSGESHKVVMEASTAYLYAEESPKLISGYNSNAKVIIVLRDPLDRAFSHYKMNKNLGRTFKSFEEEIRLELEALDSDRLSPWGYLGMSLYSKHVARYSSLFGTNLMIINFEELISDQISLLQRLGTFLNIDMLSLEIPHKNESISLRFKYINFALSNLGIRRALSRMLPSEIKLILLRLLESRSYDDLTLDSSTKQRVNSLFEEDKKMLNKLYL